MSDGLETPPERLIPKDAQALNESLRESAELSQEVWQEGAALAGFISGIAAQEPTALVADTQDMSDQLIGSIRDLKASLEKLLQRDAEYARSRGDEKGPVTQMIEIAKRQMESLDENTALTEQTRKLTQESGIDDVQWLHWLMTITNYHPTLVPPDKLVDYITGCRSLHYMDCMSPPGVELPPHALRAAEDIALNPQKEFPIDTLLADFPLLWRDQPIGPHTKRLLQQGQKRGKGEPPAPANENERTK